MPTVNSAAVSPPRPYGSIMGPGTVARSAAEPERRARILSISSFRQDHSKLRSILCTLPLDVAAVATCRTARTRLHRDLVSAVLCEQALPDGTWRDILEFISHTNERPPLIVTSMLADDHLWAEVLNLGGYDVLVKPFHEQEVRHALAFVTRYGTTGATDLD